MLIGMKHIKQQGEKGNDIIEAIENEAELSDEPVFTLKQAISMVSQERRALVLEVVHGNRSRSTFGSD
jgi:hypothetical protein